MGKNSKNKKPAAKAPAANTKAKAGKEEQNGKKRSGTEIFLIVFGIVALLGIVASIIVGVVVSSRANYRIDYLNDDLSRFVYLKQEDYRGFEVEVNVDPVDDFDIDNAILQALCTNKTKEPKYNGIYLKNQNVNAGDVLYIYYRGYTLDDNGNKVYFDGGCNFSGDAAELEIGSGGFIPGFELNLVGKNPKNYGTFNRYGLTGIIGENDKIFVSYVRELNDGTVMAKACKVIALSNGREAIDTELGTGFYNNIVGKQYGTALNTFTVETDNGVEKFKDVTVYRATGEGDLIQLTYSAFKFDGTVAQSQSALIDLSDPNLDKTWGEGFAEFFEIGAAVGTKAMNLSGAAATLNTVVGEGEKNSYFDMTVNYVYKVGENPLNVEAYFPTDYSNSEELAGVTAYFDVYIMKSMEYDAPEFNDAFITDTLKLKAEDLAEYEGDTLTEKYKAKLRADLEAAYLKAYNTAIDNAIWEQYLEKAIVKRLPEKEVREYYDSYYSDIASQFSYYSSYYESIDAFAREYMGLSAKADWKAELQKKAEQTLTQKIAFYYVMRTENLLLTDEEFEEKYVVAVEEQLEQYLKNVNCTRDKYDSDEAYEKAKADYKESMLKTYTREYFREVLNYENALETLRTYVVVK